MSSNAFFRSFSPPLWGRFAFPTVLVLGFAVLLLIPAQGFAQPSEAAGGEANLHLPDLNQATFLGIQGGTLLMGGLVVCALGLLFGFLTYLQLRDLPVHKAMREVSELIWETCKTYLFTQGKFLLILEFSLESSSFSISDISSISGPSS